MDVQALRQLKPELDRFLDRYAPLFGRDEAAAHAHRFVQGLLLGGDRRSVENIAEAIDGCVVRSLQKFIAQSPWSDDQLLEQLQGDVVADLGDPDAVLNVDETGFPKKGTKSVGVKRQYSGTLGRTDNCQVGVFVNYRSTKGHALIDRRLFVPEEWAADAPRRTSAGVPEALVFRTKPQLALGMVQQALARQMPFTWVTGDSVYGDSPTFVQGVRGLGKWYVVDTSADARVWVAEPVVVPAGTKGTRGRATTAPRVTTTPERVDAVVAGLPATAWTRVVVAEGSQGPRIFEYASLWVWFSEEGLPSGRERLLVRRSVGQEPEVKCHRSNAPAEIPVERLAQVRGCHWSVEQSFQAAKGECGLDEYETRGWVGWHHHTALSLLALWFLARQKCRLGEKRAPDERARGTGLARPSARHAALG
ncbi:IS701 family transposase [Gemmata sp. JC717]|uniref:IS701 family transposase n=1 Tax=Gemmata algarum TaxID=2975278 RepID=UPI0021BB9706|nr:IS701 family transposase [Gemmata algarum]MDY3555968.1 IS701 family transposase [Gemmata algarum]